MSSFITSKPVLCATFFLIAVAICLKLDHLSSQLPLSLYIASVLHRWATLYHRSSYSFAAPESIGADIVPRHNLCVHQATGQLVSCQSYALETIIGALLPNYTDMIANAPHTFVQAMSKLDTGDAMEAAPFGTYYEEFNIDGIPALLVHRSPKTTRKTLLANGVIIHLHGGGYVVGSYTGDHRYASYLALFSDLPVLAYDYKLAPRYPLQSEAILKDAEQVILKYVHQHLQVPFEKIYVTGTSAGGGLSLILMHHFAKKHNQFFGGVVPVSPWADVGCAEISEEAQQFGGTADVILNLDAMKLFQMYVLGCRGVDGAYAFDSSKYRDLDECIGGEMQILNDKELNPVTSNWNAWSGSSSNNMKLLIIASKYELLRDDSLRLKKKAEQAGLKVELRMIESGIHCLPLFVDTPEGLQWTANIAHWIRSNLAAE